MNFSPRPAGRLRVGLFTHSTNPRGGVVHALELANALATLGHEVVVHAPDEAGAGFFRDTRAGQALIPATAATGDLAALVRQRVREYLAYLLPRGREFDVYHAHDGITGNVLADLADKGVIPAFVRTVHHLDHFADPFLSRAQDRSVTAAGSCFCVSQGCGDTLLGRYGIEATLVRNGVDTSRFSPPGDANPTECVFSPERPVFLAVGGIERRKNTVNLLRAFLRIRRALGRGTLLIAGGASLLDHSAYRREFDEVLSGADSASVRWIRLLGKLSDAEMVSSYRAADALLFPSVIEGFGLAVLEAMACGTPVITSNIPPFTEYLTPRDALLVDPDDVSAIAEAARRAIEPAERSRLRAAGLLLSARFSWNTSADLHVAAYERFLSIYRG